MSNLGKRLIAAVKASRERAAAPGFAQTPLNPKHVQRLKELKGFFAQLTPEQQKAALEYRGEDC